MTNQRRYGGEIERLRSPQRLALLEVDRVVDLALAGLTEPKSMVDIGTGSAIFAEAFTAKGLRVAGIDLREDMLAAARDHVPAGDFRLAHMEKLPFDDEQFDFSFMGHVLHEADDLLVALKEAKRVAKKRVVVLEWPHEEQEYGPPMDHRLPDERIKSLATDAGFTSVEGQRLAHMAFYRLDM